MNESQITQKITKSLKVDFQAVVFKMHGHAMQVAGIPDFYIAYPTFQGWIEAKMGDAKLTLLQLTCIKKLRQRGANAFILRYFVNESTSDFFSIEDDKGNVLKTFSTYKGDWKMVAQNLLSYLFFIVREEGESAMENKKLSY